MLYSEFLLVELAGLSARQAEGAVRSEVTSVPNVALPSHLRRGRRLRRVELELHHL